MMLRAGPVALAFMIWGATCAAQSVDTNDGLAAWDRLNEVFSHPRCTNCHVGVDGVPRWDGLIYGKDAVHGMGVRAGDSRVGAETVPCRSCHVTSNTPAKTARDAPRIADAWRLPPPEMAFHNVASEVICDRLSQIGPHPHMLMRHFHHSAFVAWALSPGEGREAPPGTMRSLTRDLVIWMRAGRPCG